MGIILGLQKTYKDSIESPIYSSHGFNLPSYYYLTLLWYFCQNRITNIAALLIAVLQTVFSFPQSFLISPFYSRISSRILCGIYQPCLLGLCSLIVSQSFVFFISLTVLRVLVRYFIEHSSIWVCLMLSHD